MKKDDLDKDIAFLFRFLKERGLYTAYRRYIRSEKTFNIYQIRHPVWSFRDVATKYGVRYLISFLISWSNTKEGFTFWNNVNKDFMELYDEKRSYTASS